MTKSAKQRDRIAHLLWSGRKIILVKEEPHHSFGHDLVGQNWELKL